MASIDCVLCVLFCLFLGGFPALFRSFGLSDLWGVFPPGIAGRWPLSSDNSSLFSAAKSNKLSCWEFPSLLFQPAMHALASYRFQEALLEVEIV